MTGISKELGGDLRVGQTRKYELIIPEPGTLVIDRIKRIVVLSFQLTDASGLPIQLVYHDYDKTAQVAAGQCFLELTAESSHERVGHYMFFITLQRETIQLGTVPEMTIEGKLPATGSRSYEFVVTEAGLWIYNLKRSKEINFTLYERNQKLIFDRYEQAEISTRLLPGRYILTLNTEPRQASLPGQYLFNLAFITK